MSRHGPHLALIAVCLIVAIVCCVVTLAGYQPPLNGLTVIGIPALVITAAVIARGGVR